jgi:DNA-directed RNA polymerase subunit H (RpoH/RPB5)
MADSHDGYILNQVYSNLIKMLIRREVVIESPILSPADLIQQINTNEYVILGGKRGPNVRGSARVVVILIAPRSRYQRHTPDVQKLLKLVPKVIENEKIQNIETPPNYSRTDIIFVTHEPFGIHVKKKLIEERTERINIEDYGYAIFSVDLPSHICVPPHSIPPKQEIDEFCELHHTTPDRFPKILMSDPQAVWLGLRPKMVVRIDRFSETSGTAVIYRYCV